MSKMTLERAKEINGKLIACYMGVSSTEIVPQMPDCSLAEMLEAQVIIEAENRRQEAKEGKQEIHMVVADRGIAAMYALSNYHTTHQTADEIEPIMLIGSVGLFNIELTEG